MCGQKQNKRGVKNDPLGQAHSPASSGALFSLESCVVLRYYILKTRYWRTNSMCENSDHYRSNCWSAMWIKTGSWWKSYLVCRRSSAHVAPDGISVVFLNFFYGHDHLGVDGRLLLLVVLLRQAFGFIIVIAGAANDETWVVQWSTSSINQSTKKGLTLWSVCFVLYGRMYGQTPSAILMTTYCWACWFNN